jgi:hypothetical protein
MEQSDQGHLAAPLAGRALRAVTVDAPLHTPGPWCLFPFEDGWHVNQQGGSGFVETIRRIGHRAAECEANARLIAAAPDLLAALDGALTLSVGHAATYQFNRGLPDFHPTHAEIIRKARTAIAKALGSAA